MPKKSQQLSQATQMSEPLLIEVDVDAIAGNVRAVRSVLTASTGESPKLMAVVKADGYGHGIALAAQGVVDGGADALGVTFLGEAAALSRAFGGKLPLPILIFAPMTTADEADLAVAEGFITTVCDEENARLMASAASTAGVKAHVHLKVDTGMGRFGLKPALAIDVARQIAQSEDLVLDGVYTHFGHALAPDLARTNAALAQFTDFCDRLVQAGIAPGLRHCANSAAALRVPASRLDMVRIGTVLYGQYPASTVPKVPGLSARTWAVKARVAFVHDVPPGDTVGYGSEFRATTKRRVAVLPVGFADGFATSPNSRYAGIAGVKAVLAGLLGQGKPYVTFDGHRAPVIGRVAMQTIVVDVTDVPATIAVGSVAEIPMRRLAARSSIPRLAKGAADDAKKSRALDGPA